MRVLLIEPTLYSGAGAEDILYKEPVRATRYLALTLPYLAALTPEGWQVELAYEVSEDLERNYDLASYDLIGITAQTIHMKRTLELARSLKKLGRPVVVGGPITVEDNHHLVSILSRFCTSVVVGEAEGVWPKFLRDLQSGSPKKVYQNSDMVALTRLPLPRFDLVNLAQIAKPHVLPAMTSRGCPRKCAFCSEFLYGTWRVRPVDEVVEELAAYKTRFGISRVAFRDDNLLVPPKRSRQLLRGLTPLELEWSCQTDLNLARHPDLVELAIESGMRSVSFGLESIVEQNRDAVRKGFFAMTEVEDLLQRLYEKGVEVQVNVIFGFDHDTPDVFDETVEFLIRNNVSRFFPSILFPIPGTSIYEQLSREGRLLDARPPGIEDPLHVGYTPKHLSVQQLADGYLHVQKRFRSERRDPVFWLGENNHIWTESNDIC